MFLRNNKNYPLTENGQRRHGQFEWHNANCLVEDYGVRTSASGKPHRAIWCATHGQWAIETPVKVTYTFEDGTTKEIKL